jgi:hypothetical protein
MLTYLFDYLEQLDFPGAGLFQFISFRASMALITSLIISIVFGKRLILLLRKQQIGETVRDLGLTGQIEKQGCAPLIKQVPPKEVLRHQLSLFQKIIPYSTLPPS